VLKFIFWTLLCINGALFAYGQGYLGNFKDNQREPARLKNQLNTDKLVVVSAATARGAAAKGGETPAPAPAPAVEKAETIACMEIGSFSSAEAKRFDALLAPLELGERQSREQVGAQEATSHIVYIPPLGSKEAAERKASELKTLGVTNFFIMSDSSSMKWGISLGVFKSETAAKTLLAALNKQGVSSARVTGRGGVKQTYQFRDIDADTKARLEKIIAKFPEQDAKSCK
jgi:cell division septation protein DedD